MPFTAKGGRYLEVHVKSSGTVRFVRESYLERTHFDDPVGSFECEDVLLNKIWMTGVNTVRSCSEDAFVDCPTRERGQWTGDVASVATDIAAVAWSDLSLARRALVQAAQAAREDGLVAGVGPGDPGYLSTYAAQWVSACLHYWELTGDKTLLTELLPAAQKNLAAFRAHLTEEGLNDSLGWGFIDWGYVRNQGPSDMALNIHYLMALRAMTRWERSVGDTKRSEDYNALAHQVESVLTKWLDKRLKLPGGWNNVGYHVAALSLLADVVPKSKIPECKTRIKSHLLECFPNKAAAPRLSDPSVADEKIMTPYFCHFSFAALLQHGEAVFVLDQYRKCWGWALGDNRTTWLEVFDTRWSHCHEWSGCPTWQLSRHILGLQPRFDLGPNTFMLQVRTGGLSSAKGIVPTPSNNQVSVSWKRLRTEIIVTLRAAAPINVLVGKNLYESKRFMKVSLPLN